MSAFAQATFNAAKYSASRPTYPPKLFEHIFQYYTNSGLGSSRPARWDRAVDLGCGTGQATSHLTGVFKNVVCIDPSVGMLRKAREYLVENNNSDTPPPLVTPPSNTAAIPPSSGTSSDVASKNTSIKTEFSFLQGSAEDLHNAIPDDGSVDLLIAAQACHWFDWEKVWPETKRVLRKDGIAAFWVYGEIRFSNFPSTSPLITEYHQGTDPKSTTSVGAFFQRPGRTVLERSLVDVPSPAAVLSPNSSASSEDDHIGLTDFRRVYFTDDRTIVPPLPTTAQGTTQFYPTLLQVPWRWIDVLGYIRTASALHTYHEHFPNDHKSPEDTRFLEQDLEDAAETNGEVELGEVRGGDIAVRFWKDLRENVQSEMKVRGVDGEDVDAGVRLLDGVTVEWPLALLLVRRR